MKYIIILFALAYSMYGLAQKANGIAINKLSGEPLPFIQVVNKSNNDGVLSNYSGVFTLKATLGKDTLLFIANGFVNQKTIASKDMLLKLSPSPMG